MRIENRTFQSAINVIHSDMPLEEALKGINPKCPKSVTDPLVLLSVRYFTDESGGDKWTYKIAQGQMIVHEAIMGLVEDIFETMWMNRFPLTSVRPISAFGWDDESSMAADNTSGFCYRPIAGPTKPSRHALGMAFDINPKRNVCLPNRDWIHRQDECPNRAPKNGRFDPYVPGTFNWHCPVIARARSLGFVCGIDWDNIGNRSSDASNWGPWDPQHFDYRKDYEMPLELPF